MWVGGRAKGRINVKVFIPTIGTRGDVQPYVALGVGFAQAGHDVTVATLAEFDELVTKAGLGHATIRGSFLDSLKPGAERPSARAVAKTAKLEAPDALRDEWDAAQGADVVVYNPAAWGGFHIAEKLGVPGFAAFPTPLYSPTTEYPSPFLPFKRLGPLNKASHRLYMKLGPVIFKKQIKEWRRDVLGLPPAKSEWFRDGKAVTRLYGYSPTVVPRSTDWDESSVVTGYWFLDLQDQWDPPRTLLEFLEAGSPPVYVGFGSMVWGDAERNAKLVMEALARAGRRGILSTSWTGIGRLDLPDDLFAVDAVPHDWLFPRVSAVVHHGGAGTTGAGLLAGKPTVICPFITDQRFWGQRVEQHGCGPAPIRQRKLTAGSLGAAINAALQPEVVDRAEALGRAIRSESGVATAVAYVLAHLDG